MNWLDFFAPGKKIESTNRFVAHPRLPVSEDQPGRRTYWRWQYGELLLFSQHSGWSKMSGRVKIQKCEALAIDVSKEYEEESFPRWPPAQPRLRSDSHHTQNIQNGFKSRLKYSK